MLFRKPKSPIRTSFRQNVTMFWDWYAQRADRFLETIDAGRCEDLTPEITAAVDEYLPCLAWEFGPAAAGQTGRSFTLSPEGNPHRRFLSEHCVAQAPKLPGWTFYASRQPSPSFSANDVFQMHGEEIRSGEIWVTAHPQQDHQLINLSAWHPSFERLPEKSAYQIVFILLDDALGEDTVEHQIGDVHIRNNKLAGSLPIHELREEVEKINRNWEQPAPINCYRSYQLPEPSDEFPRADTIAGSTRHHRLINEFLLNEGKLDEDPFVGTGAVLAYVSIPTSALPRGDEARGRGELEDAVIASLERRGQGELIGGAIGVIYSYIDLLIYDHLEHAIPSLQEALQSLDLPEGATSLHPFFNANGKPLRRW